MPSNKWTNEQSPQVNKKKKKVQVANNYFLKVFSIPSHQGNARKTTPRSHLNPGRTLSLRSLTTVAREHVREGSPCSLLMGCKLIQPLQTSTQRFLKKKNGTPYDLRSHSWASIQRTLLRPTFEIFALFVSLAALSAIARKGNQDRSPSTGKWITKGW